MTVEGTFNRAGSPRRTWLLVLAFQLVTTGALAQEEKPSAAPSLPDTATEEDATAVPSSTQLLEKRIAELNREFNGQRRPARPSPAVVQRLRRLRLLRAASATTGSAGSATRATPPMPQYSTLLVGLPRRHPRHARSTRAARRPTSATARHRPLRQRRLGRRAGLHRSTRSTCGSVRSWPSDAILRTSVNFAPRTGRQDFSLGDSIDVDSGRARVRADRGRQDVDLRGQDAAGVRHRVQGAQVGSALRHHPLADRPLHDRARSSA